MHDFRYKNHELHCESVRVSDVARQAGTPFYLYSSRTIRNHYTKLVRAFKQVRPLICYSMKANSNLSIVKLLLNEGAGLDIVSGGELHKALKAGANPRKVVYAGVGKSEDEIRRAIQAGILMFNVESIPELTAINRIAHGLGKVAEAAIRLNPDVDAATHKYITTAKKENKFGIDFGTARDIFTHAHAFRSVKIIGLHMHIGSQITQARPFLEALRKAVRFIGELRRSTTP